MDRQPNSALFVVDDDDHVRELLFTVFAAAGYKPTCFADADSFMSEVSHRMPACVLLDIHMPGRSGLDTLTRIDARHFGAPIVVISAPDGIHVVVDAVKRGAFDFIEKPFEPEKVVARVSAAIAEWKASDRHVARHPSQFRGHEILTPREHEVLARLTSGESNKEAARQLGISPRTVEVHRFHIMEKLQAKNAADLMRIVLDGAPQRSQDAIGIGSVRDV